MKKLLRHKLLLLLAFMVFYSSNAISKEDIPASIRVATTIAVYVCMESEGFYAPGKGGDAALARLVKEGLTPERVLNLMNQPIVKQQIQSIARDLDCTKLGGDVEKYIKKTRMNAQ